MNKQTIPTALVITSDCARGCSVSITRVLAMVTGLAAAVGLVGQACAQTFTDAAAFHAAAGVAEHLVTADTLPHATTLTN